MRTSKVIRAGEPWIWPVAPRCGVFALLAAVATSCTLATTPRAFAPAVPALEAENKMAGDPYGGRFPFSEAVAGLGEEGALRATFETELGAIRCRLDLSTPITVANFVGLARGLRPFLGAEGEWIRAPFYDGTSWHRAEVGEFVQAGKRGALEGPGYRLQDEMSPGQVFDRGGILAMANRGGEHSGGSQFFITTNSLTSLNGQYTIFGNCDDEHVVRELERRVAAGERPGLKTVTISRDG